MFFSDFRKKRPRLLLAFHMFGVREKTGPLDDFFALMPSENGENGFFHTLSSPAIPGRLCPKSAPEVLKRSSGPAPFPETKITDGRLLFRKLPSVLRYAVTGR